VHAGIPKYRKYAYFGAIDFSQKTTGKGDARASRW